MHSLIAPGPLLMAAKLFQPLPLPNRVERIQLIQHINAGLAAGRPVTLVSAPAGYGKSTLVAEWAGQAHLPVTWLALDETDDEPVRFFTYFIAALQRVVPNLGRQLQEALHAGQLPLQEVLLTALVNDWTEAHLACILVLDDFQSIQDGFIHQVLNGLITHLPPQCHVIFVTREDPALPLARLRARNQLTEIRARDLRFSDHESERFLHQGMGLALSEQTLALLQERTEGWVAGLQLAGLSMQGHPDPAHFVEALSGNHRYILSYLTEEVLNRQPPDIQDFLLQTAILSGLQGDLCAAVTGQANSAAILEHLLTANLFLIPLDDEQRWYRYHHLFADLLLNQLRRIHPEQMAALHQRASRWYESQNMPAEAIEHALGGKEYARTLSLLDQHIWTLLNQGLVRRAETWMKTIPADWSAQSPRTNLGFAWLHLLRGNFGQIIPYLEQAEMAISRLPADNPDTLALQAECLALQSNLMQAQGRIPAAIEAGQSALQRITPEQFRISGLAYLGLGAAHRQAVHFDQAVEALQNALQASRACADLVTGMLAVAHITLMSIQHGRLRFAAEIATQAIAWMDHANAAPPPIVGAVYGALGLVSYEWNQIAAARDYLQHGIRLGTFSGHNASVIYSKVTLARLQQAEGELQSAALTLEEAAALLQNGAPGWVRPGWIVAQVRLLLKRNDPAGAETILRQSNISIYDDVNPQTDEILVAWLHWLYHNGNPDALQHGVELAGRILAAEANGQRNGIALQALVAGALFHTAAGNLHTGLDWLKRALTLAEPEGYIRLFTEEGLPLASLLQQVPDSAYVKKLLSLMPAPARPDVAQQRTDRFVEALSEPLTERELEVLRLLAHGLTYAGIAACLVISVNTVRYHVKGIYAKLGVDKQAKAIEAARQLNLL